MSLRNDGGPLEKATLAACIQYIAIYPKVKRIISHPSVIGESAFAHIADLEYKLIRIKILTAVIWESYIESFK